MKVISATPIGQLLPSYDIVTTLSSLSPEEFLMVDAYSFYRAKIRGGTKIQNGVLLDKTGLFAQNPVSANNIARLSEIGKLMLIESLIRHKIALRLIVKGDALFVEFVI